MEGKPLVSIIVNNYNYQYFLADAIDSALGQSYSPIEVIVVDDGSTDNSRQIIASYGKRITPVFKENGGQASAFNAGFEASRGEIICLLDADDTFSEHKAEAIVQRFTSNPSAGWCFHLLMLVDESTRAIIGKTSAFPSWSPIKVEDEYDFRPNMKSGKLPIYHPPTSGLCFRRSLLERILPMPITFIKTSADHYLRCAATWLSPVYILTETLAFQRLHGQNAATSINHHIKKHARGLVIAYLLRVQFPGIEEFSNRMFARNLGIYWTTPLPEPEYRIVIEKYFALTSILERSNIYLRAIYSRLPFRERYTHQLFSADSKVALQTKA
ncbi:MAG: glycosyltransferase family 2 protein [Cyanophyceae cyanobacterium]